MKPPRITTDHVFIRFYGICTNFLAAGGLLPQGVGHRVVLVNAYQENIIQKKGIPPHLGSLLMPSYSPVPLAGCTLTVANAVGLVCSYDSSFKCIPNLTAMNEGLGSPSSALVAGQNPGLASCYFDFTAGEFFGCLSPMGAATTSVRVETLDTPQIAQAPFPGTLGAPCSWRVPNGSVIHVIHAAPDESTESPASVAPHFLLHYLTAEKMPADPHIPSTFDCKPCAGPQPATVGVSCSNSTYP